MESAPTRSLWTRPEELLSISILAVMAVLPLIEIVGRRFFDLGIPGSILIVQNLTLWITFVGATLAARRDRLLALSTAGFLPDRWRPPVRIFTSFMGVAVSGWLLWAMVDLVKADRESENVLTLGVPVWLVTSIMPLAMAVVMVRMIQLAAPAWPGKVLAATGVLVPLVLQGFPTLQGSGLLLPALLIVLVATILGLPIFAAIGGIALLLFWNEGTPIASVPVDVHRLTASPVLPAVPLFTLSGYILAAGGASQRLVRVFTAWVGWLPGGGAIVTALVFAFFTSFTGASGVTILSLGGLLVPVLIKTQYPEDFSIGLVTVSGSIGLLFPPSLPVILYGVYAKQPIDHLFVGGLLPGFLLVLLVAAWGVRQGLLSGSARSSFRLREAAGALWEAKWELLLPVVVLVGIFGGFSTVVEAASLTVLYAFIVECFVYRDLDFRSDLPKVLVDCGTLIGGFLIILGMALGLTNYLTFAEVPTLALEWVQSHIESPILFLLALNLFLLVVGALMDIYSAIFVVVPLITPMGAAYGIDPIHLGIIFLANLELGYLTPPMGENLFLSAYRFGKPVMRVFRFTLPFYLILALGVLLVTYLPFMTLGLVSLYGR